jgi:hypothetical protein
MSLIFVDSFDHYATADFTKKWSATGGSPTLNASGGRRGGGALQAGSSSGHYLQKALTPGASWVVGFSLKFTTLPVAITGIVALFDVTTLQCDLRVNTDGTLSVTRNGTALTNGTSTYVLSPNTEYFIEWKVTIANSIGAGTCVVRVNGAVVITVATSQDTQNTANASASMLRFGYASNSTWGSGTTNWDDFYLCDQSGSAPTNDFLGDCRVDAIFPNGNGNYSQFAGSDGNSVDNYLLVDETTPNTTDYNDGDTVGDRDSYAFGNLAALTSQTVYAVQVNAAIVKDDAGAKSASTFARSGSTNTDGASAVLGTSQVYISQIYEADPNGGGAWTETSVNAAEFGVRVTA